MVGLKWIKQNALLATSIGMGCAFVLCITWVHFSKPSQSRINASTNERLSQVNDAAYLQSLRMQYDELSKHYTSCSSQMQQLLHQNQELNQRVLFCERHHQTTPQNKKTIPTPTPTPETEKTPNKVHREQEYVFVANPTAVNAQTSHIANTPLHLFESIPMQRRYQSTPSMFDVAMASFVAPLTMQSPQVEILSDEEDVYDREPQSTSTFEVDVSDGDVELNEQDINKELARVRSTAQSTAIVLEEQDEASPNDTQIQ
jgi:hypothetical protein